LHTRFRKEQSGNPGGRSQKRLHALLADALSEQVFVTIDEERRKITKREAVVHRLVNKSATADLRATKMLFDMIKDAEQKASVTSPASEPRRLDAADKEVVQQLVDRIRRQILAEMAAESIEAAGAEKGDCRFRRGHPQRWPSEKAPMTDDQLAKELRIEASPRDAASSDRNV
jgi:hypothetical protein